MKNLIKYITILFILYITGCTIMFSSNPKNGTDDDRVSAPYFSPPPSRIDTDTDVSILSATPNADIYYTTDGSTPSAGSGTTLVYSSPVTISPGTLIRAYAVADNLSNSLISSGYYSHSTSEIQLGVNISWFNTWNESQPLANVASTGREVTGAISVDNNGQPDDDFDLVVYEGFNPGEIEGAGGGAQFGTHTARFTGQAVVTASGGSISNFSWDPSSNVSTFLFTTTEPTNSILHFSNTRRTASAAYGSGISNIEIMRPSHNYGDLLNSAFTQAMEPFSSFRVGPNWDDYTYDTSPPVWNDRGKPDGIFNPVSHNNGLAPWEILIAMANELQIDLWISLPPNGDDDYLTKIFQIFRYGSDGVDPYTSTQLDPVWEPLDTDRKLYFEVGNEIWNTASPYGAITNQMQAAAIAEVNSGDPHDFNYANGQDNVLMRNRYAYFTARASEIARSVVGDSRMMTQYRPVISGQSAFSMMGEASISYLRCVLGGHNWYTSWGTSFPGGYIAGDLHTPEDGVSVNPFGNVARPLSYWIYGYAVAPYINGGSVSELTAELNNSVKDHMNTAINVANNAGIVPLAYEGGIERYNSYTESGLDTVLEDMLSHWFAQGGGTFMYYAFAGNTGSGIYPDLTKQDPDIYPKIRAVRNIAGLD